MSTKRPAARRKAAARAPAAERNTLLDPIFDAIRKLAGTSGADDASNFASGFYRRLTEDELPLHSADGWAALANDFLDFARKRRRGKASLRMFNPAMKTHGWDSPHTVLQIVNDDMPFLVDSVTMALAELGIGVHVLGHPVMRIARDKAGKLTGVGGEDGEVESLMHLEIDRQGREDTRGIEDKIRAVLDDVRAIVADWKQMRDRMQEIADEFGARQMPLSDAERREAEDFLRWAAEDHFTFFGYRQYTVGKHNGEEVLRAVDGSGLGLLRGEDAGKPRPLKSLAAHYMPHSGSVDALILTKTNSRSSVHRPGYMDYVGVLTFDKAGKPVAEDRFLGPVSYTHLTLPTKA
jgi:glutamate dehydrogenase